MIRKPHIEAKSSSTFEKSGKAKLLTSGKLLLQKPKKQTRVMTLELTRMTANRPNQSLNAHHSKKKKKDSSSKKIKPPDDNLDEYFGQHQNSQETADVTSIDTPKKSEEAKSKNDPDGSSHRRVDKSPPGSAGEGPPKLSSKSKQPVQDSADSSCGKVHKLP